MALSVADRLAIHELISLHGHLADDRRPDELDRLLTDDAVYDLDDVGGGQVAGLDAIRRLFAEATAQPLGHHVTNVVLTNESADAAHVRSKGLSVMADGRAGTVVYEDDVVRTSAGWRIAYRKVVVPRPPT